MASSHHLLVASFHPPTYPPTDDPGSWVLLDAQAYISDHENASTAGCHTRDDQLIKVTFCLEKPPVMSHFCIHRTGLDLEKLAMEPNILATADRFVLLRVPIGPSSSRSVQMCSDYFIYQASLRRPSQNPPSLRLLPNPHPFYFSDNEIGILPRHTHKGVSYVLAALHPAAANRGVGVYNLYLFNGEEGDWTSRVVSCNPPLLQSNSFRCIHKVITIGGKGGSMGWVDLWGGILICDVLSKNPVLQYIAFPTPVVSNVSGMGSPKTVRDIVAVRGTIKYFAMNIKVRVDTKAIEGWIGTTWSSRAGESWKWRSECTFDVSDVIIDSDNRIELLSSPKDKEEMKPTLSLLASAPALSLEDDDLVYLMAKVGRMDDKAWILAVDMKNQSLEGMAEFGAERTLGLDFTHLQSRIPNFLFLSSQQDREVAAEMSGNEVARAAKLGAVKANGN